MWVKICGINNLEIARRVADLQPDAIGLNFYANSPRNVTVKVAAEIAAAVRGAVEPVGLFVNHAIEEIVSTSRACGLSTLQLHGDEPASALAEIRDRVPGVKFIRVFRLGAEGLDPLARELGACARLGVALVACLIDARVEGSFGGTGTSVPWETLVTGYRRDDWPPLILAGGLHPDNVGEAIRAVRPWGVDVASGVEWSPGQKDVEAVSRFIRAARAEAAAGGAP